MRRFLSIGLAAAICLGITGTAFGQSLPLVENDFRNTFSAQGAPPDPFDSATSLLDRTTTQFESGTAFGGWQTTRILEGSTLKAGSTNAEAGPSGTIVNPSFTPLDGSGLPLANQTIQLTSVQFARTMVVRAITFSLGSEIPRPDRKPDGTLLDPLVLEDREFYLKEPANADTSTKFYWSPHAQKVFAAEPGVVVVQWEERVSGNIIQQNYTVSGSPVKPTKTIYWTESTRGFNGPTITVPESRVGQVNIIFSPQFPADTGIAGAYDFNPLNPPDELPPVVTPQNPLDPPGTLPLETKTLWYSEIDKSIHAYNQEGRVLVELLGDLREPDRVYREHLGLEIVDVVKETRPEELRVSIGERVLPADEGQLTSAEEALVPQAVAGGLLEAEPYLYEHLSLGGTKRTLYAIRKTTPIIVVDRNGDELLDERDEQQSNEVLIYWKEQGIMQLEWPKKYVGYIFKWPEEYNTNVADTENVTEDELRDLYSLYARPEDAGDSAATGVQLNSADNPVLTYQDDVTRQHAQITAQKVFYTVPGSGSRSLIRYTRGEEIWFERVYSQVNEDFEGQDSTTPVLVGNRIEPPAGIESSVGYIRQTQGDAFNANPGVYLNPFEVGFDAAAAGAIIPVNALASNNILEVWWYEPNVAPAGTSFNTVHWPSQVRRYQLQWPVTDPDDANLYDEIVLARNDGSGDLGIAASGSIYRREIPTEPGYNPNEEHALMSGGVAWALRDDLNTTTSSEPFVLVDYTAEDGRPAMAIRRVVRENATHTFNYEAPVGVVLQAPMPLPVIPLPVDDNGNLRNTEVGAPTDEPANFAGNESGYEYYTRFTYADRKGSTWVYRGPNANGVNVGSVSDPGKSFQMHYFYKTQAEFDFPGITQPAIGTIVNYLRPFTNGTDASEGFDGDLINGDPLEVTFTPVWPSNPPILNVAETLGLPKRGLPAVLGQTSARILYEQSIATSFETTPVPVTRSAKLFDPTREKVYEFVTGGLEAIPGSVETSNYLGKTYFPQLPPHLSQRLYFDPNRGELGALVFIGEFVDAPAGEDYFLLNVMSPKDIADAKALVNSEDLDQSDWETAIDGLSTTLDTYKEDPSKRGTYIVDSDQSVPPIRSGEVAEIVSDETAVNSYAISAVGGGTGYVVLATGNGEAFTPNGDPVSLHVFKVAPPLYRGELKVVESANPLDEKVTLRHSGDFAGDPSDYEFAWITGQPVSGLPPELYSFSPLSVLPNTGRSWQFLNNPGVGYAAARDYAFDDSSWDSKGTLGSNQLVINDGNGTAGNGTTRPDAILRDTLDWLDTAPIDLYLSFTLADNDGAAVYLNGAELAVWNVPGRVNSVTTTPPSTISGVTLPRVFSVAPESLQANNTITVDLYTSSNAGAASTFDLRLDSRQETANLSAWQDLTTGAKSGQGESAKPLHTIEGASILTLTDNYVTMRYRAKAGTAAALATGGNGTTPGDWSRWLPQQLVPGWIKRVLGGINPFEQRVTDLFNNPVNTDVSLLTQAGARWEGDVALNLANIDDFGLIEIYETVLRRGKGLSIDGAPPLNVPAANDALLLAAGYLNDLYILVGNEAFADAANPTIAFSSDNGAFGTSAQFGDLNTALFAFKGQLATVLDEELGLLRGRDNTLQPRITVAPFYNRLFWNFTNGINSGEAVYALNYNIKDLNADGVADATDAVIQFPQGHGDAYGHYLTALKGYYGLLHNPNFAWTPRIEAVLVLDQPVSIDYQDERKFAAAAAALARTASQTLDLTYRKDFTADENAGWEKLSDDDTARGWGTDEWATRGGLGSYFHWVTANSILPANDTVNTGIQKVDRSTVPELDEVAVQAEAIQLTLDKADARLNPLGLAKGALSFDISPSEIDAGKTHFEQVYDRALGTLQNAKFAFDNAKDSTQLLRRQEDTLDDRRHAINVQETAYENDLIELYGTPYPDDIGPGKTYVQGYEGPDLLHYQYIDTVELFFTPSDTFDEVTLPLDPSFIASNLAILNYNLDENGDIQDTAETVTFSLNARNEFVKPAGWSGRRAHPGLIQAGISDVLSARLTLRQAADDYADILGCMEDSLQIYATLVATRAEAVKLTGTANSSTENLESQILALKIVSTSLRRAEAISNLIFEATGDSFPLVNGFSNDFTFAARGAFGFAKAGVSQGLLIGAEAADLSGENLALDINSLQRKLEVDLETQAWTAENRQLIRELQNEMFAFQDQRSVVDLALRDYDQTQRALQALTARGLTLQKQREVDRKRSAAIVQGYRTRDLAFRVFRDEALEKYKALFDLAARYTFLASRAYDYETGLLNATGSSAAAKFYDGIVQSRALGVLDGNGNPQFSASTTGDPGLAGVLAQLQGDWSVAESRLGFNNPDNYQTTFSLREEQFRIIPADSGDGAWKDKLASFRKANVLDDPDVRRYCMQIASAGDLPVPGLVIPFQTTIADGANFFGQALAGGDHTFSPSSFATKIRNSGIAFEGYIGMDAPTSTSGSLGGAGGSSPPDPDLGFLDPESLSATPYIYLVPAGVDSMRSPPLGDTSTVRTWSVDDQAIPLPFNIGNTDFSTNSGFISSDSLSENPFQIRKHQAFRAVPTGTVFSDADGFTNSRLIGRSVWNSNWKLVIPGKTLRANPDVGLDVFLDTVTDIELFLQTYSYSGN